MISFPSTHTHTLSLSQRKTKQSWIFAFKMFHEPTLATKLPMVELEASSQAWRMLEFFSFLQCRHFMNPPTQLLEIGGELGEYKKCWDGFFFWVVKKGFILETGGKPKEFFKLKIGGKLR